jgi:hypothetical protein
VPSWRCSAALATATSRACWANAPPAPAATTSSSTSSLCA